jgi:DNA-binding MarR family transcriptional regulator
MVASGLLRIMINEGNAFPDRRDCREVTASVDAVIEDITDNLLNILPLVHRKLLKIEFERVNPNLSRLHFIVLRILSDHNLSPISEIGKNLFIPRPQMTALLDRLIALGLVTRLGDAVDRRVINIALTPAGRQTIAECDRLIRASLRQKLSSLSSGDLLAFRTCTATFRDIGAKLD